MVALHRYDCDCPCCRDVKIVDDNGEKLDVLNIDHFDGRELVGVSNGWAVCRGCNTKLRTDPQFKISRRKHFEVFHDYRAALFGRGKGRSIIDQMEFTL